MGNISWDYCLEKYGEVTREDAEEEKK